MVNRELSSRTTTESKTALLVCWFTKLEAQAIADVFLPGEALEIGDLEVLGKTFAGNRPAPSGKHHAWDQIFARVDGRS